nr:Uncharacterised protein [Klebsiella pneumoniae]
MKVVFNFYAAGGENAGAGGGGYRPSCRGGFAAPARFAGKTFEIASDSVTGRQLEGYSPRRRDGRSLFAIFRRGAGRQSFLHKLTGLVDDGRLAGHADLDALRQLHPQLHTFAGWLAGPGRPAFERALTSGARWAFDR